MNNDSTKCRHLTVLLDDCEVALGLHRGVHDGGVDGGPRGVAAALGGDVAPARVAGDGAADCAVRAGVVEH